MATRRTPPLRVLAVVDGDDDPASEALVARRLDGLAASRVELAVATIRMSERARNRLRQRWPSYTLSDGVPPDWASVRSLVHALRDSGAQVLYCNGIAAHACAALAGPYQHVPVVAHLLDDFELLDAHAAALCGSTLVVASDHARAQAAAGGVRDVVRIGTPLPDGCNGRAEADRTAPRAAGARRLVGWAGVLDARAHPELFLRAARLVAQSRDDIELRMLVPDVAAAARFLAAADVHAGRGIALAPLDLAQADPFGALDVLVQTGWRDATHLLTLEALGAGIPVVATAVSGRREYLSPATQGWLARAGNEHDVAQAIVEALAAPQARVAPSAGLPSIAEAGKAARAVLERVRANMGVRAAA